MLSRLIAHRIAKRAGETKAKAHLRDKVLPTDTTVAVDLFEQLRDSFQKRNPVAGAFLTAGNTHPRFQQILTRYIQADDDLAFIAFTRDAMGILHDEIASKT